MDVVDSKNFVYIYISFSKRKHDFSSEVLMRLP